MHSFHIAELTRRGTHFGLGDGREEQEGRGEMEMLSVASTLPESTYHTIKQHG
jgi:hypothetical protein